MCQCHSVPFCTQFMRSEHPAMLECVFAWQVGPFSNPSETYQYYNLPFCTPKEGKEYKTEGLGEVLEGDRLVNTPYSIKFRVDKENEILCSRELTEKDLKKFRKAVKKDYYFQASTFITDR